MRTAAELFELFRHDCASSPTRKKLIWECAYSVGKQNTPGEIVECGVWRGGTLGLIGAVLADLGDTSRYLWGYDTFCGMTPPGPEDTSKTGDKAEKWVGPVLSEPQSTVKEVFKKSGYPEDKLVLVEGDVRKSGAFESSPTWISLLHLDTDWYDSTLVELHALFDKVVPTGWVIFDDYWYWDGQKKAVDEFFSQRGIRWMPFDYDGSVAIYRKM